jgi:hypothetical protein
VQGAKIPEAFLQEFFQFISPGPLCHGPNVMHRRGCAILPSPFSGCRGLINRQTMAKTKAPCLN